MNPKPFDPRTVCDRSESQSGPVLKARKAEEKMVATLISLLNKA